MLKTVLLSTAALALVATAANAGPKVTLSHDNRFVSVMPGKALQTAPSFLPKKGSSLYSTVATDYPDGLYFCCYGSTLSGPSSFFGEAYGIAEQFTPSKTADAKSLMAAVGYVSGDKSVTLTLYADNGSNSPGAELASATGTTDTEFGECCGLVTVKIKKTSLTAGTNYWVGITTTGSNFEAAPAETVNEVVAGYVAGTSNGGGTWGAGYQSTFRPAIAVN